MPLTPVTEAATPPPCDKHPALATPDQRVRALQAEHREWHVWYVARGAVRPAFAWHAKPWRFDHLMTGFEPYVVHADYDVDLCAAIRAWEAAHPAVNLSLRDRPAEPPDDAGGWASGECAPAGRHDICGTQ